MATCRATLILVKPYRQFLQNAISSKNLCTSSRLASGSFDPGYTRDPGEFFFNNDIQLLLEKITGCDYETVFRPRRLGTKLEPPRYELLTQDELDKIITKTKNQAKHMLKMPPLIQERKPIEKILDHNPEIQGFDTAKYVFTDITYGIPSRKRKVVVREPDGSLREASWEERTKMCQIYFPAPGRELHMPKMFEDQYLQNCLERGQYEFVLDRACAQFEPDDPNYIRVTRTTYNFIDDKHHYSALRSTRHFGPMALHLVLSKRMDDLLCYFVSTEDTSAAADLVRIFHKVNSISSEESDDLQLIQNYIQNDSLKKPTLELSWQTYLEIEKQRNEMASKLSN